MTKEHLIELEYIKLKDEQIARIGFRDNMVYLSLIAIGAICSFAITDASHHPAFLVLPWANTILGWLYVVNDEKISAIGRYIRRQLVEKVCKVSEHDKETVFGWEVAHRTDAHRVQRKVIQCFVDLLTFPVTGFLAIIAFFYLDGFKSVPLLVLAILEAILLGVLAWQFIQYADLKKGR